MPLLIKSAWKPGKPLWESRGEAGALAPRVDLVLGPIAKDISDLVLPDDAGRLSPPIGHHRNPRSLQFPAHQVMGKYYLL